MRRRTKIKIKRLISRLLFCWLVFLVVAANFLRLRDNVYSNYEKAADYGSIKDNNISIEPVIAAVFYLDKNLKTESISTYFNHTDNYKKKNVKLIVAPKKITKYGAAVIEKLYEEIRQNNTIKNVVLVYDETVDLPKHKKILQRVMDVENIYDYMLTAEKPAEEDKIESYLNKADSIVIVLADLTNGIGNENSDFLVEEAIYLAQKHSYQMSVFDVIDTQIARAVEKDYATLLPLMGKDEPLAIKQKENLERYKNKYWRDLVGYFEVNLVQFTNKEEPIMPPKNKENYRLYDRGSLIVKVYDDEYNEIYESAMSDEQDGVIVSLAEAAKQFVHNYSMERAEFIRIYLLTDKERVEFDKNSMLMSQLEEDDGVYARYRGWSSTLVADDRPDNPEDLVEVLREKADIPADIADEKINFYKFKTVEIKYGY
jgi:hypothetical protein